MAFNVYSTFNGPCICSLCHLDSMRLYISCHNDRKWVLLVFLVIRDQKYYICNSPLFHMIFKWHIGHSCNEKKSVLIFLNRNSILFFYRERYEDSLHNFIEIFFPEIHITVYIEGLLHFILFKVLASIV